MLASCIVLKVLNQIDKADFDKAASKIGLFLMCTIQWFYVDGFLLIYTRFPDSNEMWNSGWNKMPLNARSVANLSIDDAFSEQAFH